MQADQPSPVFGLDEPMQNMMSALNSKDKMANVSKAIFGADKIFDLTDLVEAEEQEEDARQASGVIGKAKKRKELLKKSLLLSDPNLGVKVNKFKNSIRQPPQDESVLGTTADLTTLMRTLKLTDDYNDRNSVDELLKLVNPESTGRKMGFEELISQNMTVRDVVMADPLDQTAQDESLKFYTPEEIQKSQSHFDGMFEDELPQPNFEVTHDFVEQLPHEEINPADETTVQDEGINLRADETL